MLVTVADVLGALEQRAPARLAEDWDNVGLQVGNPQGPVRRVLTALEVTDAVLAEAVSLQADLVVSHHPLIFRPLRHVRLDDPVAQRVARALQAGVAVAALHTNFDIARGGLNDLLAAEIGLRKVTVLDNVRPEAVFKLAVFVPATHLEAVHEAVCGAGAGHIGKYSDCTFRVPGTGTFRPLPGADPYLGEIGEREEAAEVRLETIVPEGRLEPAIRAMLAAHPYEEVAYDVFRLDNPGVPQGLGCLGSLPETIGLQQLAELVRDRLGLSYVRVAGDPRRGVRTVAVCGGAGASVIPAAVRAGADVLITGDLKHHDADGALDRGLALIDAGHFGTEKLAGKWLAAWLEEAATARGWPLHVIVSQADRDPFWSLP